MDESLIDRSRVVVVDPELQAVVPIDPFERTVGTAYDEHQREIMRAVVRVADRPTIGG